jgi:hypothetical protein
MKYLLNVLLLFISLNAFAQSEEIVQQGNVAYHFFDRDSIIERQCSFLCNSYINKYYINKKLPLIYLVYKNPEDSLKYQLSYDNLMGKAFGGNYKNPIAKYYKLGIRITIYNSEISTEDIIKLLDYGINHLGKLKRIRRKALRREDNDPDPEDLQISQQKINLIISEPLTDRMKVVFQKETF